MTSLGLSLKTSFVNLYQAVPQDRATLKSLHLQKMTLLKNSGVSQFLQEGVRTAINLIYSTAIFPFTSPKGLSFMGYKDMVQVHRSFPILKYLPDTLAAELANYLPPIYAPIKLVDKKNGYTCYQLTINEVNRDKVEQARALVAKSEVNFGYEGWSDEIDRGYDYHAFYFIVEDREGQIVATSRLVRRIAGGRAPLEDGLKADGTQYSLEGDKLSIIDINSFYNKKGQVKALFPLFAAMGRYAWLTGAQKAFCMLDEKNKYIVNLYTRAKFRFSDRFSEKIYYPTFGKEEDGKFQPTFWKIMEMNQLYILLHSLRASKFQSA